MLDHLRRFGPAARVGIGAPSLVDVRDVCAEGESGLLSIAPDEFPTYHRSIGFCEARHAAGGYVRFMGSESPRRWNGPQWSLLWWDEWPLCNHESYRESQFGLRLGARPVTLVTGTPKRHAIRALKLLAAQPGVFSRPPARTQDNPYLSARRRAELERDYGGTTLGRMELLGELVQDVDGALWRQEWIDAARVTAHPDLDLVVVSIDPNGTSTPKPRNADTGLAWGGRGVDGDYYVLGIEGVQLSPAGWARRALDRFDECAADRMVAERNYGGAFVEATLRALRPDLPLVMVTATRGKAVRAEPVAALYEQGRVHHVGLFAPAEDQLCGFPVSDDKRDMVDTTVWLLTELSQADTAGSWEGRSLRPRPGIFAGSWR